MMSERWVVMAVPLLLSLGCHGSGETDAGLPPSLISIGMADPGVDLWRPAVTFDHEKHTTVLGEGSCAECHLADDQGKLSFRFQRMEDPPDPDDLMNLYHDACGQCHQERSEEETPVACAECHRARGPGDSLRAPMSFDYSLHARHSLAEGDKCETCHHVYNEATERLEYVKGQEGSCRDCHGAVDEGNTPSLARASHGDCVNCHLAKMDEGRDHGPVLCIGCHDAEVQDSFVALEEIPRIPRDQPDTAWIKAEGGESPLVPFNHLRHEPQTRSCSTCHHQTLKACRECHTLRGTEEGKGVILGEAYHDNRSEHSCVGCHKRKTREKDCRGCHHVLNHPPGQHSCPICHSGPLPAEEALETPPDAGDPPALPPLPEISDDFPETVVIDGMVDEYGPSTLPHQKIVAHLHEAVGRSPLARRFHGSNEVLCSGCHHESTPGTRPPPCSSCHDKEGESTVDKPGLKDAYHRQCLGCHQEMGLAQQGCTDCHESASKEDR
jgi:hypothetical protein